MVVAAEAVVVVVGWDGGGGPTRGDVVPHDGDVGVTVRTTVFVPESQRVHQLVEDDAVDVASLPEDDQLLSPRPAH